MTAGNAVAAERALREGVRLYPSDLLLRLRLALLLVEQRRLDSAREQLSEALRIDPQSFEARQLLARIDAERIVAAPLQSSTPAAAAETEKNARSRERPVGGERVREGDRSPSTVRNEMRRDEGWGDEWDDWESP
jgi:predicted Zn-dependent protease